jgi:magnesium chelatase family protein
VREQGVEALVVPAENGAEAAMVDGIEVLPLESLAQIPDLAAGEWAPQLPEPLTLSLSPRAGAPDLADLPLSSTSVAPSADPASSYTKR